MEMKRPYSEFCAALTLAGCVFPRMFGETTHIPAAELVDKTGRWWVVGAADAAETVVRAYGIPLERAAHPSAYPASVCFDVQTFRDHIDLDR
jgi:hypothetical protein